MAKALFSSISLIRDKMFSLNFFEIVHFKKSRNKKRYHSKFKF